jgi:spore germination protein
VQVDGTPNDVKTVDLAMAASRPKAFDQVVSVGNTPTQVYFAPVGHILKGPFLKFWNANGGLPIFGYPLSEEFQEVSATDGKTYTVQYFERNRFELHPEFAGTRNEVLMGLLGVDTTRGRTFPPGAPFESDSSRVYFKETQHSLSGAFLKYWKSHGGLPIFGYPISEELQENGFVVQYFERNRFELHPEFANTPNEVLLGLLGVEVAKRNGWIAP